MNNTNKLIVDLCYTSKNNTQKRLHCASGVKVTGTQSYEAAFEWHSSGIAE